MQDAKICPRGYELKHGLCSPKKKFISFGTHEAGEMFILPVGNLKYVAFYLSFEEKPKVRGLTIPSTRTELKRYWKLKI